MPRPSAVGISGLQAGEDVKNIGMPFLPGWMRKSRLKKQRKRAGKPKSALRKNAGIEKLTSSAFRRKSEIFYDTSTIIPSRIGGQPW